MKNVVFPNSEQSATAFSDEHEIFLQNLILKKRDL